MSQHDDLVRLLRGAQRALVVTGAGISTPSGIPDFRGPQGVWKRRKPVTYDRFLASHDDRVEYWDYKLEGWPAFQAATPNPIHTAIAEWEHAGRVEAVVTQNVDGLHRRAGTSEARLVEIHGTNGLVACQSCGKREEPAASYVHFSQTGQPPSCGCGGWLKPATISFGQSLVEEDLERALSAAAATDLVVALGSTLSVEPAASVPLVAAQRGTPYVIVNRGETAHDGLPWVTLRIDGALEELFPQALAQALSA